MFAPNHVITKRIFIAIAILVISCSMGYGQKFGKISDEEWQILPPKDYPEANAIIIFDKGKMEVKNNNIVFERHVRMKVFTKAGLDEIGDIEILYSDGDKIKNLKAHTITPDGKKHKVEKKDILEKTINSLNAKTFAFPNLDTGCIVEYKYKNVNERFYRFDPWYFQSNLYTLSSEYKLILWFGYVYSSTSMNIKGSKQDPVEEDLLNPANPESKKRRSFTWSLNNLRPIKNEPYMSFKDNYRATLYNQLVSWENEYNYRAFSKTWQDIGQRWQKYIDEYTNAKKDIRKLADSLSAGFTAQVHKAKALYDYVINEIETNTQSSRYLENDKLSQVLKLKSGTDDEKNILLVELLKAIDIPAWPVLIGTRNKNIFIPRLRQDHQFNRMITQAKIGNTPVFLDAKSKYCPFGVLPANSRTNGGLMINGENSEIVKLSFENPETYRIDSTKMHINGDGTASCSTSVKFCGYYAALYGRRHDNKTDDDFIKDYFLDKLDVSYEYDNPNFEFDSSGVLSMDATYTLTDYTRMLDNNCIIKPVQYSFRENPFKNEQRFFPIDFNYPFIYQNVVEITFENTLTNNALPKPILLQIPGATFEKSCELSDNKIIVDTKLTVEFPIYPIRLYSELRNFFIQIASSTEDEVVLTF